MSEAILTRRGGGYKKGDVIAVEKLEPVYGPVTQQTRLSYSMVKKPNANDALTDQSIVVILAMPASTFGFWYREKGSSQIILIDNYGNEIRRNSLVNNPADGDVLNQYCCTDSYGSLYLLYPYGGIQKITIDGTGQWFYEGASASLSSNTANVDDNSNVYISQYVGEKTSAITKLSGTGTKVFSIECPNSYLGYTYFYNGYIYVFSFGANRTVLKITSNGTVVSRITMDFAAQNSRGVMVGSYLYYLGGTAGGSYRPLKVNIDTGTKIVEMPSHFDGGTLAKLCISGTDYILTTGPRWGGGNILDFYNLAFEKVLSFGRSAPWLIREMFGNSEGSHCVKDGSKILQLKTIPNSYRILESK